MAQTVKLKRSNTAGTIPTTSNLALGEVAINTKDGKFFLRKHVDGSTGDAIHAYAPQGLNAFGTQELVVKVVTKTTAHPNHGNGSSSGYTVQGLEGPFLALIPGNTYKFDVSDSTNSGHPFRFYLDAAKATAYTTGVTTSGSAGNSGAYVQIAVTTSTPQVLYYQCSSHSLMGSAAYVASDAIAANSVGTSQIAQNSITSSEIPDNSIGATQISAAVLAAKQDNLGNNSITAAMISTDAVGASEISANSVGISELNVSDGSSGQVLTTDGSGTLSFSTVSGGGGGTVSEAFKTISVSGQSNVVADGATDTLTLAGSGGMTITTTAGTDTVTFSSSTTPADDSVTTAKITDLNVTAGKLAANSVTSAKIATDAVGASEIAANSVGISELNVSDGSANQVLTTDGSGTLSFANPSAGTVTEAFKTLAVSGQDNVVADAATDTLTFAAGSNMTITTNASNDTITFASSGSGGSSSSFAKNTFTGDGSTTAFTLTTSMSTEDGLIVFIEGVYQADNVYSVSGTTLTFATAPVNGRTIEVFQMEGGIVGTAPILATMTGDGSDTTLALGTTPSSENQCFVTIDGVMQHKSTYSVSGSTLTFSTAPPNGTAVEAITLTNTTVATFQDSDGDTKIQMEESSDEDKIRFDVGGTQMAVLGKTALNNDNPSSGNSALESVKGLTLYPADTNSADGLELAFKCKDTSSNAFDGKIVWYTDDLYYIGLDDSRDELAIGYTGTTASSPTVGSGTALRMTDYRDILISKNLGIGSGDGGSTGDLYVDGDNIPAKLQVHEAGSGVSQAKFTNGTTGKLVGDGFNIGIDADEKALVWNFENTDMKFATNNTERMVINSSGNVGIGTSSPSVPLDILTNLSSDTTSSPDTVLTLSTKYASTSSNGVAGAGPRLEFKIPDDETNPITGAAIAGLKENADDSIANAALAFYTSQNDTTLDEAMRITSAGNVGIGVTAPANLLQVKTTVDGSGLTIQRDSTTAGTYSQLSFINTTTDNYTAPTWIRVYRNSGGVNAGEMTFGTAGSERMRINGTNGHVLIGKTVDTFSTAGTRLGSNGNVDFTRDDGNVINVNRTTSNGSLIGFYQDGTEEGNISVSGTNVSYNGFTGTHESSGIAADTSIGTVCSTIDELDTYVSGNKEGQTRIDHAKIKVSDTVGDSRVYGILSSFTETDNKPIVASVGIGSVRVTGACEGGDLLESNGDGTAKVQDDDIIRSKTIGKVTIGNSDTAEKLVSCVLYCG